jgi:hypothetical protein
MIFLGIENVYRKPENTFLHLEKCGRFIKAEQYMRKLFLENIVEYPDCIPPKIEICEHLRENCNTLTIDCKKYNEVMGEFKDKIEFKKCSKCLTLELK